MENIYNNFKFLDNTYCHGVTRSKKGVVVTNHVHTCYEILLLVSGRGEYVVENQRFEVKPYTLIVTKPMEYHLINLASDCTFERYYVQFDGSVGENLIDKLFGVNTVTRLDENDEICKIFRLMDSYNHTFEPSDYPLLYQGLLLQLIHLVMLGGDKDVVGLTNADEITAKAIKYIAEHISEPMSIDSIASALYVSPSFLCHKFSSHMHTGIMQYVKQKRIHLADKMLKKGVKPTAVAVACGYGEYSTFYRVYKEIFGVSPKESAKR